MRGAGSAQISMFATHCKHEAASDRWPCRVGAAASDWEHCASAAQLDCSSPFSACPRVPMRSLTLGHLDGDLRIEQLLIVTHGGDGW